MPAARDRGVDPLALVDQDDEQMVRVPEPGGRSRTRHHVGVDEQCSVPLRELVASFDEALELPELAGAERRLDVGEPVVEAELLDVVDPAALVRPRPDPVMAKSTESLRVVGRVGGHCTTLAGRDRLDRVEREAAHVAVRAVADRAVRCCRADGVRGVFDHDTRPVLERGKIDGKSREMDGHEGIDLGNLVQIEVERGGVDVDEHRCRAHVAGAVRTRCERER